MLRILVGLLVIAALTGCTPTRGSEAGSVGPAATPPASTEASTGVDVPANDPAIPHEDARGRTPDAAVMALIDALQRQDWKTAYSLYATPSVDAKIAANEWAAADEHYAGFTVRETRVTDAASAFVRVTYDATTTPPGGAAYPVHVPEPGEWWPLHKVDGQWKTGWMPRQ